jgi:hypothetical protein
MNDYVRPSFPLYEFAPEGFEDSAAQRRLWHWNGQVGASAESVILAWTNGSASALVDTTRETYDATYARYLATHLALSGTFLPTANRPAGATQIAREMERLRDDDSLWLPIPGLVSGATHAESAICDGYALAYTLFDGAAVFIAAIDVKPADFKIRVTQS